MSWYNEEDTNTQPEPAEGDQVSSTEENTELETPGTDIQVPESDDSRINIDVPVNPNQAKTRIGKAVLVQNDEVINVLRVVVDEDNNVVGFTPEYGMELIVVDDDAFVGPGFVRVDGEFVDPESE